MTSTLTATPVPPSRPLATCSPGVLDWSINSRRQDPCFVASTLGGVCFGAGGYSLGPLPPEGDYQYRGITGYENNPCLCNTVYYSLESACSACQHPLNGWDRWLHWATNCSTTYTTYPRDIPPSIAIPAWAYLDVTAGNTFNITLAQSYVGFSDSVAPPEPTSSTSTTSRTFITPTQSPTSQAVSPSAIDEPQKQTNTGAIVGGVVGGLAVIVLAALLAVCLIRRRENERKHVMHPLSALDTGATLQNPQSPASPGYGRRPNTLDGRGSFEPKYQAQYPTTLAFNGDQQYSPEVLPHGRTGSQPASPTRSPSAESPPTKPVIGQTYYKSLLPEPIE